MSKLLVNLVDKAIAPSLLLVLARIAGLVLSVYVLKLDFAIEKSESGIFPYLFVFRDLEDAQQAGALSSGLMIGIIAIGAVYSVYKLVTFQGKRISPLQLIKLADKQKLHEIESSIEVYSRAIVWCLFSWVTAILTFLSVFKQMTPVWMNFVAFLMAFILTMILVKNFEMDYTES